MPIKYNFQPLTHLAKHFLAAQVWGKIQSWRSKQSPQENPESYWYMRETFQCNTRMFGISLLLFAGVCMFLLCLFVLVSRPVLLQRSSFWNCFLCSSATWRCWKLLGFLPGFHDGWCASFSVNSLLETDRPGCFVFLSWKGKLSLLTFVLILVMKTFLKESSSPCGSPDRLEAVLHSSSMLKKKKKKQPSGL